MVDAAGNSGEPARREGSPLSDAFRDGYRDRNARRLELRHVTGPLHRGVHCVCDSFDGREKREKERERMNARLRLFRGKGREEEESNAMDERWYI